LGARVGDGDPGRRRVGAGAGAGERRGAVGGTRAGRPVPAGAGGAPGRTARAVVAAGHVERRGRVGGRVGGRVVARTGGTGQRVHGGDDRRGGAGAAVDLPARVAVGVVHGDAGVRVGDRGHVRLRPAGARGRHGLPGRLGVVRGAAGTGAAPGRLRPAARVGRAAQRRAADRRDVPRRGRVRRADPVVAAARGDHHARGV